MPYHVWDDDELREKYPEIFDEATTREGFAETEIGALPWWRRLLSWRPEPPRQIGFLPWREVETKHGRERK